MNLQVLASNKKQHKCCSYKQKNEKEGLQTLCWGLPPRLITCRRWRLRYLVGDGFAVRIPHRSVQGALRRAKGKTSSAERYEVNPSFFVASREGFVQSVTVWQSRLQVAR